VARPHGLRGEVVVDLVTNRPEQRLAPGSTLATDGGDGTVTAARPHHGRWLVTFAGVTDRDGAEALGDVVLRGQPLEEDGTLWVHELVGAPVVDAAGVALGTVEAVEANPASDLLVLAGERLVPLTFVVDRRPDGTVVVDPPAGLLD